MRSIDDIIEGTINCWQIEAKESCDLPYQLKLMVGNILEDIGRKITERAQPTKLTNQSQSLVSAKALSVQYQCLFGTTHKIEGDDLLKLNHNLSNHVCNCGEFNRVKIHGTLDAYPSEIEKSEREKHWGHLRSCAVIEHIYAGHRHSDPGALVCNCGSLTDPKRKENFVNKMAERKYGSCGEPECDCGDLIDPKSLNQTKE